MSVDILISSCIQPGTSYSEKGRSASIAKGNDETVLLFKTDCDIVRRVLSINRACDIAFLYMKHRTRPILLFVELKGKNINDAAEQIKTTMQAISNIIRNTIHPRFPEKRDVRAIVVRSGSAPQNQFEIQEKFFRETGVRLQFAREKADLRQFITS
jgi:hypothetical protein